VKVNNSFSCCQIHRTKFRQEIWRWNRTDLARRSAVCWIRDGHWQLPSRCLGFTQLWT